MKSTITSRRERYRDGQTSSPYIAMSSIVGVFLVVGGMVLPSSTLISFLRPTPVSPDLSSQLLLGGTLFRIGLVVHGLLIITLGRLSIWKSECEAVELRCEPPGRSHLGILAALLLVALVLRLYRLDSGLWLDEILTHVSYARMSFGEIVSTYASENQHLLYTLLAHTSFEIFGESAWSLRLPAVFFGIGSIWVTYLLGREVSSTAEALFSAALLTFSYHHIWFSQNARGYTGLLFWTILTSWLFLRGLREESSHLWLLYAIASALGVYTHLTMLFVVVGHFITYLITRVARRSEIWADRWARSFLGFSLAGSLTMQLHALVLPQMLVTIAETESLVGAWKRPGWTLLEMAKGMQDNFAGGIVSVAALLVFGAGLVSFARRNPVLIQLLVIPPLVGTAVVAGRGHHLWPRFFFFTMGLASLVVVRGVMLLGHVMARVVRLGSEKRVWIGTALCGALIAVSAVSIRSVYGPKQDYESALAFVEDSREPGDAVVVVGLAALVYEDFYQTGWEMVDTLEALDAIRSRAKRTWLVYTLQPVLQSVTPEIAASIRRDFTVVEQFPGTLGDGTIFVCRSDMPPPSSSTPDVQTRIATSRTKVVGGELSDLFQCFRKPAPVRSRGAPYQWAFAG